MFGYQFFPTPPALAHRMLEPYRDLIKKDAHVLDPSAGKGDLLKAVADIRTPSHYRRELRTENLYAVELDFNLQAILREQGYKIIGDDWMEYSSKYDFDLIVMNPPFAVGAEHLLKAWDVMHAGHIVCLLNAQTLQNTHTAVREQLALLVKEHGSVEYLVAPFRDAERTTDVKVALVRLEKKGADRFKFEGMDERGRVLDVNGADLIDNLPARNDLIDSLVMSYDKSAAFLEAKIRADYALRAVTADLWREVHGKEAEEVQKKCVAGQSYYNEYLHNLKLAAWQQIFRRTESFRAVMTTKVVKDFQAFMQEQGQGEFTRKNIMAFFDMLVVNRNDILSRCVNDVFDRMCSLAPENKVHWEGWATNDAHRVNKKVILPWYIRTWTGSWGTDLSVEWSRGSELDDIDRALCLVTGKRFEDISRIYNALDNATKKAKCLKPGDYFQNEGESEFFTFRYFKKGTLHLFFKDTAVLDAFNLFAARGKNWLPGEKMKTRDQKRREQEKKAQASAAPPPTPEPEPVVVAPVPPPEPEPAATTPEPMPTPMLPAPIEKQTVHTFAPRIVAVQTSLF